MADSNFKFKVGEDLDFKFGNAPGFGLVVKPDVIPVGEIPTETKEITIIQNGTTTHDVTNYASAEITVDVPGYTLKDMANRSTVTDTVLDLTGITWVTPYAYYNCDTLKSVYAPDTVRFSPSATSDGVGSYVFYSCNNLESIYFPKLTAYGSGGYQFASCPKLTTINMPSTCGQRMFQSCTGLKNAVLHGTGTWNSYAFNNCTSLEVADTACNKLNSYEFQGCTKLTAVILRRTAGVCTLSNINNFNNTPFASGKAGGTLYVPSALIDTYKAATNWTTLFGDSRADGYANNQILPIEGSIYETKYADGTDI